MKRLHILYMACSLFVLSGMSQGAYAADSITPWESGLSPTITPGADSMPKGLFSYGLNFSYSESPELRLDGHGASHAVETHKYNEAIKLRYGITENLGIRMAMPIYNIYAHSDKTGETTGHNGIADTGLFLDYRFLNQKKGAPFSMAISLGGFLPTANVGKNTLDAIGDDALSGNAQTMINYRFGRSSFDTQVMYTTFTKGMHNFTKGDRVRWNTAYSYSIDPEWEIGLETTYEHQSQDDYDGISQHDADTEWYGGVNANYNIHPWNAHIGVYLTFPLYRHYQSTSASDDFRVGFQFIKAVQLGSLFD